MTGFTSGKSLTPDEALALIDRAATLKSAGSYPDLSGSLLGLVFFNQSLRTKVSFEAAMVRSGGSSTTISPGSGSWAFETELGAVMNGDKPEHIKEAVQVLSRYVDAIGVRSFASLSSLEEDAKETILNSFIEHSTVPVISLESTMEHPCQMIADMLTIKERLSECKGKHLCIRWAPHVKALPMAVPQSAALGGALLGMNVTVATPSDAYQLEPSYEARLRELAELHGTQFQYVHDLDEIPSETEIIYVKSWGAPAYYGDQQKQKADFEQYASWMVEEKELGPHRALLHCLPVRRNVVISDAALDSPHSKVIDQAENRLWGQLAVLEKIFREEK